MASPTRNDDVAGGTNGETAVDVRGEAEPSAEEPSSSSSPAEGVNGDSNAGQAPVSDAEAARIAKEQAKQRKYRSPLPQGVPLPVAEHDSLHTYVQRARNISVFSIAFTLACAIVGLSFAWGTNSSALLGYSLEALVDVWSSVLVLWRFWKDPDGEGSYFLVTRRRESRASVGIAFTFVIIGYVTCWQAVEHLIDRTRPEKSEVLLAISGTSVIILSWSCAIKFSLAKVLRSTALRKDAITSGACAIMAGTMLVTTTIIKTHENLWWLDAAVAIAVSCVLSILGLKTLATHPWWRKDFWVDGAVPEEEARAEHIMEMPFHGSPKRGGGAELQMQQLEGEAAAPIPENGAGYAPAKPGASQYIAEVGETDADARQHTEQLR